MFGVNCGSGQRRFESTPEIEWINVDKVTRPGHEPDLVCDGARLPYEDGSVDYFVLHHVLEHFGCGEAADLIQEAYRVLRQGGSLIVLVPNMEELCLGWQQGKISTQIFMTNVYGAYMGHEEDRHKWGYNYSSLRSFLIANGSWFAVSKFGFRPIHGASIAEDWWILGVEARK